MASMTSHTKVKFRHGLRSLLTPGALKAVCQVPRIISRVRNWPTFIIAYGGFRDRAAVYRMRCGATIATLSAVDTATVMVNFIREDYGRLAGERTVIDIGANIGVFSLYAATTGQVGRIYAYEPIPTSFEMLQHNIRMNGLEGHVIPVRQGVAGTRGSRDMYLGPGSPFSSFYKGEAEDRPVVLVECVSLADIFETHRLETCDLLKLDCEGAEFEILYGAPASCLARINQIRLEYQVDPRKPGYDTDSLLAFMEEHGFAVTKLDTEAGSHMMWVECMR